jgi:hypothetical protein
LLEKICDFKSQASTAALSSSSHKKCAEKVMVQSKHIVELERLLVNKAIEISQLNMKLSTVEQELNMVKSCNKIESKIDNQPKRAFSAYYSPDYVLKPNIVASTIELEKLDQDCINIALKIPQVVMISQDAVYGDSNGSTELRALKEEMEAVKQTLEIEREKSSERITKTENALNSSKARVDELQFQLSSLQSDGDDQNEPMCAGVTSSFMHFGYAHKLVDSSRVVNSSPITRDNKRFELEEIVKEYEDELKIKNSIIESLEAELADLKKNKEFSVSSDDENAMMEFSEAKTIKNKASLEALSRIRDPIVDISKIQLLNSFNLKYASPNPSHPEEDITYLEILISDYIQKLNLASIDSAISSSLKTASPLFEQDKIIRETIRRMQQQESRINQLESLLVDQCSELRHAHEEKQVLMREVMRDASSS